LTGLGIPRRPSLGAISPLGTRPLLAFGRAFPGEMFGAVGERLTALKPCDKVMLMQLKVC
jgi:hypothetical protein